MNKHTFDFSKQFLPHYQPVVNYIVQVNGVLREAVYNGELKKEEADLISTYILKGSRGSGKTIFVVRMHLLLMYLDNRVSWIAIMDTIKEGGIKLIREYEEQIKLISEIIPDFEKGWIFKNSTIDTRIVYDNGKWLQEIPFFSIKDLQKAGSTPLRNNYYAGYFLEEGLAHSYKHKIDMSSLERELDGLGTIRGTISRKLPKDVWGLINFEVFNPVNSEFPLLKNFNKYLPDNLPKLKEIGYDMAVNLEDKELYHTSSAISNYFIRNKKEFMDEIERYKETDPNFYDTLKYGINGFPTNLPLSKIWKEKIIEYNVNNIGNIEEMNRKRSESIISNIGIALNRGNSTMSMITSAYFEEENQIIPVKELIYDTKDKREDYDTYANEILDHLELISKEFYSIWQKNSISNLKTSVIFDKVDTNLLEIVKKLAKERIIKGKMNRNRTHSLENFKFKTFNNDKWTYDKRIREIRTTIGNDNLLFINEWTPELYRIMPLIDLKDDGSRQERYNHNILSFEFSSYLELDKISKIR